MPKFFKSLMCTLVIAGAPVFAQDRPMIVVTGQAEMTAPADMATVTFGVRHDAPTSAEAMDAVSIALQSITATLDAAAVPQGDVQTGRINLIPRYGRTLTGQIDYAKIESYTAEVQLTVKSYDLPRLGGMVSDLIAAGANTVNGITFGLNDPEEVTDNARRAAVADARHRAEVYAEAAGEEVGGVLLMTENGGGYQPMFAMMSEARSGGPEMDVPLSPGVITVSANITVHFEIAE